MEASWGDLSATKAPDASPSTMSKDYTNEELKGALDSMLGGSDDPDYDARHIFGHGQEDHQLSMLQIITATRILDYNDIIVSKRPRQMNLIDKQNLATQLFANQNSRQVTHHRLKRSFCKRQTISLKSMDLFLILAK